MWSPADTAMDLITLLLVILVFVLLIHVAPYLYDEHGLRQYPGPFLAKFSGAWYGIISGMGHRSEVEDELHRKHGPSHHISLPFYKRQLLSSARQIRPSWPKSPLHRRPRRRASRLRARHRDAQDGLLRLLRLDRPGALQHALAHRARAQAEARVQRLLAPERPRVRAARPEQRPAADGAVGSAV